MKLIDTFEQVKEIETINPYHGMSYYVASFVNRNTGTKFNSIIKADNYKDAARRVRNLENDYNNKGVSVISINLKPWGEK